MATPQRDPAGMDPTKASPQAAPPSSIPPSSIPPSSVPPSSVPPSSAPSKSPVSRSPSPNASPNTAPSSPPAVPTAPAPNQAAQPSSASPSSIPAGRPPQGQPTTPTRGAQPTAAQTATAQPADAPPEATGEEEISAFQTATRSLREMMRQSPALLISVIIHVVLFLLLAITFVPGVANSPLLMNLFASSTADNNLESLDDLQLESLETADENVVSYDTAPQDILPASAALPAAAKSVFDSSPLNATSIRNALRGREAKSKEVLLLAYGGNDETEASVREALAWLKRQQRKDGSWSLEGPYSDGGVEENRAAATAMALLAFQGAGNTHLEGLYKKTVEDGARALLRMQDSEGNFYRGGPDHHRLYTQAQATIAICELFGMTKDEELRTPAERAVEYAVRYQSPEGGWRYNPGVDSDTSVTGWFVIGLQSARMAGIQVPQNTLDRVGGFLDTVAKNGGSRYSYVPDRGASDVMTAEALLCRQYLGWDHNDVRLNNGVDFILSRPMDWKSPNSYYWYYATQVTHHMGGAQWAEWNDKMRKLVPANQVATGREKGSWDPGADRWGQTAGRLYMTCLCVYMLEVYYRHMPIYQHVELPEL